MGRSDEELVEACQAGEASAFDVLVARWEDKIRGAAYRFLGSEEEARDVAQEAFLKAYRALAGFKREARFSSWLYQIATQPVPRPAAAAQDAGDGEPRGAGGDGAGDRRDAAGRPRAAAASATSASAVRRAIDALPEEQREVVILKEYQGLTFLEIAQALDVPVSTVKTRLYRGLGQLRLRLEREGVRGAAPVPVPAPLSGLFGRRTRWTARGSGTRASGATRWTLLYGEADAEARARVEAHLAGCAACREEMAALRARAPGPARVAAAARRGPSFTPRGLRACRAGWPPPPLLLLGLGATLGVAGYVSLRRALVAQEARAAALERQQREALRALEASLARTPGRRARRRRAPRAPRRPPRREAARERGAARRERLDLRLAELGGARARRSGASTWPGWRRASATSTGATGSSSRARTS